MLTRVVERRFEPGVFEAEVNDRDIAERADWPTARVIDELERGMTEAGPAIARTRGVLDAVALGEWIHAGDVREAFGEPGAYEGEGLPHALALLVRFSRESDGVPLHADLDQLDDPLRLGGVPGDRPPARYIGRRRDPRTALLGAAGPEDDGVRAGGGAREEELNLFG